MSTQKMLRKIGRNVAITSALLFYPQFFAKARPNGGVEEYCRKNLSAMMDAQEKKLKITYDQKKPNLMFGLPQEVKFLAYVPFVTVGGAYVQENHQLYIHSGSNALPSHYELKWWVGTICSFGTYDVFNVKRTLDHELGHFYIDTIDDFVEKAYVYDDEARMIWNKLLEEGVARYFEKAMNARDPEEQTNVTWPENMEDYTPTSCYAIGYAFVKPILDTYGVKKGVLYLLQRHPTREDLVQLPAYQEIIMRSLEKQK